MIRINLLAGLFILSFTTFAQQAAPALVKVKGTVTDPTQPGSVYSLLIVNKRSGHGFFGDPSGIFETKVYQSDTILIGAIGYHTQSICLRDSVFKEVYEIEIKLRPLRQNLQPVTIIAPRDLDKIHDEMKELGYEEKDYRLSGAGAVASPITFLYEKYSKRARSIRKTAQLEQEDIKRDLLKELFRKYVNANIIDLSDHEFDEFIDFCNVPERIMKNSSQYDFIMYIKGRYEAYRVHRPDH